MHYLYKITNKLDGKLYIGVTGRSIQTRFNDHCSSSKSGNRYLNKAITCHSRQNFSIEILVIGNKDYIYGLEEAAIQLYNTRVPHGYNIGLGGKSTKGNLNGTMSESNKLALNKVLVGHTRTQGEKHGTSLLTDTKVIEILKDLTTPLKELSIKYNIHRSVIEDIYNNIGWKHIDRSSFIKRDLSSWRSVYIKGFIFKSIKLASEVLKLNKSTIHRNINKNHPEFKYL